MLSDELKKRKSRELEDVRYVVTGEGGLCLPLSTVFCENMGDADKEMISRAQDFAKVFTRITLYRIIGRTKEILYRSRAAKRLQVNPKDFFYSVY
jgi:hypothetical protein